MTRHSIRNLLVVAISLLLGACKMSCFAPEAEQIDSPVAAMLNEAKANADRESDSASLDHSTYGALLREHVDPASDRVDYAGLKKDEKKLDRYLAALSDVDLDRLSPDAQKALLINAYNAFTLKLILENYPGVESIKNLDSPWTTKRWKLAGDTLSLDDIEHGLLRPIYEDPRIHFAVNCAAVGCPPLANFAFEGEQLDEQLERVTRRTLTNERFARVEDGRLKLTKILSWYGDDFTKKGWSPRAESIPEFVAKYGGPEVTKLVAERGADTPVEFVDYDWNLNDVRE